MKNSILAVVAVVLTLAIARTLEVGPPLHMPTPLVIRPSRRPRR